MIRLTTLFTRLGFLKCNTDLMVNLCPDLSVSPSTKRIQPAPPWRGRDDREHDSLCNSNGFTLVELILYVAILGIFLTGAVLFAWDIIYGRVKSQTHQEVIHNARLVSKRIQLELKNAQSITSATGSTLTLATSTAATNPTVIDLSGGRVRIGYGSSGSCPTSSPCFLTSDNVNVSTLSFTDLSSGDSGNVQFEVTVESTADRREWQSSVSYQGSGEVRSL